MTICARTAARLLGGAILLVAVLTGGGRAEAAKSAALVMDANSGKILYQAQANELRYPASLTKMMTLYMLFEALDGKKLALNGQLKVSAFAASRPPSNLGLRAGDIITVRQAILALVTKSANDVATVVAEHLGGSEARFAQKMTAKARKLGMSKTTFRNASGLPHRSQLTTARDMATLGRALLRRFPHYYGYFSQEEFAYEGQHYGNHNGLLGNYDGIDGIKTGYIHASGFNLVASAKRNGRRVIGVVFGARSPAERSHTMTGLLDDGFRSLPPLKIALRQAAFVPTPARSSVLAALDAIPGVMVASSDDTVALKVAADRDWGVQVGAFSAARSAEKRADKAAALAAGSLEDGTVTVLRQPDAANGTSHFLAQVHGLTQTDAVTACRTLKARSLGCFVISPARQALALVDADSDAVGSRSAPASEDLTVTAMAGDWGVQVGVYPRRGAAYRMAQDAFEAVPGPLAAGTIKVVPLKGRRGPLYRARILGIAKERAYSACEALKADNTPCMVLKMSEQDRETLSAAL